MGKQEDINTAGGSAERGEEKIVMRLAISDWYFSFSFFQFLTSEPTNEFLKSEMLPFFDFGCYSGINSANP